jgi:hypothetical protein
MNEVIVNPKDISCEEFLLWRPELKKLLESSAVRIIVDDSNLCKNDINFLNQITIPRTIQIDDLDFKSSSNTIIYTCLANSIEFIKDNDDEAKIICFVCNSSRHSYDSQIEECIAKKVDWVFTDFITSEVENKLNSNQLKYIIEKGLFLPPLFEEDVVAINEISNEKLLTIKTQNKDGVNKSIINALSNLPYSRSVTVQNNPQDLDWLTDCIPSRSCEKVLIDLENPQLEHYISLICFKRNLLFKSLSARNVSLIRTVFNGAKLLSTWLDLKLDSIRNQINRFISEKSEVYSSESVSHIDSNSSKSLILSIVGEERSIINSLNKIVISCNHTYQSPHKKINYFFNFPFHFLDSESDEQINISSALNFLFYLKDNQKEIPVTIFPLHETLFEKCIHYIVNYQNYALIYSLKILHELEKNIFLQTIENLHKSMMPPALETIISGLQTMICTFDFGLDDQNKLIQTVKKITNSPIYLSRISLFENNLENFEKESLLGGKNNVKGIAGNAVYYLLQKPIQGERTDFKLLEKILIEEIDKDSDDQITHLAICLLYIETGQKHLILNRLQDKDNYKNPIKYEILFYQITFDLIRKNDFEFLDQILNLPNIRKTNKFPSLLFRSAMNLLIGLKDDEEIFSSEHKEEVAEGFWTADIDPFHYAFCIAVIMKSYSRDQGLQNCLKIMDLYKIRKSAEYLAVINSIIPHDIIPVKKAETIDLLESKIPFQSIKK